MRMTNDQLNELRKQLEEEKRQIEHRVDESGHYGLDRSMKDSVGDLSSYDNHPADAGTEMFEREKDMALDHLDEQHLRDINSALHRIEEGTYGKCLECHQEIDFERLKAIPYTEYCIEHAR